MIITREILNKKTKKQKKKNDYYLSQTIDRDRSYEFIHQIDLVFPFPNEIAKFTGDSDTIACEPLVGENSTSYEHIGINDV